MPPQAVPMTVADIPSLFRIRDDALLPSQAPVSCLLFKFPFSAVIQQKETERLEGRAIGPRKIFFFKAVDDNGTMMACMRFSIVPEVPKSSVNLPVSVPPWSEDCTINSSAWETCWRTMAETKSEVFENKDHFYLDLMATDPVYQRRGAAASLLSKLAEIADENGKNIYLVSTDSAKPSYERAGFVVKREVILDLGEMGESTGKRERFTFMIRYSTT